MLVKHQHFNWQVAKQTTKSCIVESCASIAGEMAEWSKAHAWKACIRGNSYRGFESLSLRHRLKTNPSVSDYVSAKNTNTIKCTPLTTSS